MFLANFNDGAYIFFSIIALAVTATLGYFLIRSVFRERAKFREEKTVLLEGLLSKSELTSAISGYIAKGSLETTFALIYVDIDKFTDIINAFGEKEAERALEKIAQNLSHVLPKRVQMARLTGDEFLVFLKGDYDRLQSLEVAKKLLEVVRTPIKIYSDTFVTPTACVAVCFYPKHGSSLKQLINSLKISIYLLKKKGGNDFMLYSEDINETEFENLAYYYQIKTAMKNKEFLLYYQPIINVDDGTLYGAEALLRWNHPEHGVLSPHQFINIMEQSGDIYWVGLWGIENLIKQYFEIKKDFPELELRLSLNLSPKQLIVLTLVADFLKILRKYRLQASNITLEIVEFALFERYDEIMVNIQKLKDVGFKIAIDGFGLDFATLAKLEKMPIDIIKLDRSFLSDTQESYMTEKFATLLVGFARNNQKVVISEGVENYEMLEKVSNFGINVVQGYYFGYPMSGDDLKSYIEGQSWKGKLLKEPEESVDKKK
ncbi:MAG TPA: bifunctional diguanylate cyclase/phosphodiesterase [Bacilli bacterium]|nr:MAG: Cyclic di-GMP phosphodiesterase Gmr [Tenericutes bacterium ADurb.BinA124]HNZ50719.1 bifunctional diguanylate cyclase/phosphodiesterase [Bacilli bacterium]HPX83866.1 bifunctional diguanylate cyclase/phosphodiesterase [Bacilli bacterium]HQC74925.1 bifunctional diguanylate cyclase/phosphodiesterase [Bacilli bacterium]